MFGKRPALWTMVLLAVIVFWTRFGALGVEVFDHDEATFMVMAQSILRGHLPYVEAFDNKPPGLFFTLAAGFALLGESVHATRLVGDVVLLLAAICVYFAARKLVTPAIAAAVACIYATAHAIGIALYTSAALVAGLPTAGALWLLLRARQHWWGGLLAGICLASAALVRTNLGVVAVGVGVLHLIAFVRPGFLGLGRWAFAWLLLGGLLPVVALVIPYAVAGQLPLLYASAVEVPLAYVAGRAGLLQLLLAQVDALVRLLSRSPSSAILTILALASAVALVLRRRTMPAAAQQDITITLTVLGSTVLSMLIGGVYYQHYVVQLFPAAALLIAHAVQVSGIRWHWSVAVAGGVSALSGCVLALSGNIAAMAPGHEPFAVQSVAAEIERVKGDEQVWVIEHALIMFYLDVPPLSPLGAFPSMQFSTTMTAPLIALGVASADEVARIMALRPGFVVAGTGSEVSREDLRLWLSANYVPWLQRDKVTVLRRSDLSLPEPDA